MAESFVVGEKGKSSLVCARPATPGEVGHGSASGGASRTRGSRLKECLQQRAWRQRLPAHSR